MSITYRKLNRNITLLRQKRPGVAISEGFNERLNILATHFEMLKKYVVKMFVGEKINAMKLHNKEVTQ